MSNRKKQKTLGLGVVFVPSLLTISSLLGLLGCSDPYSDHFDYKSYSLFAAPQAVMTGAVAPSDSTWNGISVDSSGDVLLVGFIDLNGSYEYGGVSVSGAYSSGQNPAVLKLSPAGTVLWARSDQSGPDCVFYGVAADAANDVYTVGYLNNNAAYTFGSTSVQSPNTGGANSLLVKYNSAGNVQWARTCMVGNGGNRFEGVAADPAGDVFAVGYQRTSPGTAFGYDSGVSIASTGSWNLAVAKFDAAGTVQWLSTTTAGTNSSFANAVAADSSGNCYVAAGFEFSAPYSIGSSSTATTVAVTGTNNNAASDDNGTLIKYSSGGTPLWAATPTGGGLQTTYNSVCVDSSGNSYIAGYLNGGGSENFGNSQTATGGYAGGTNALIVKYDASGVARWVRTVVSGPGVSQFLSVTVDGSGNTYAVGSVTGPGTYDFGNGKVITTVVSGLNLVMVKYDSSGNTQTVQTVVSGSGTSQLNAVASNSSGNVFAVGYISGSSAFDLGNGLSVSGAFNGTNALLVKYQ